MKLVKKYKHNHQKYLFYTFHKFLVTAVIKTLSILIKMKV